jgi:tagatose-1,6-bisphosphate aldolase non-catalytic subunit AgaZ/GatZ
MHGKRDLSSKAYFLHMKVQLNADDVKKCHDFAYSKTENLTDNRDKKFQDHFVGKMAETAVYRQFGSDRCTPPDYNVHKANFNPDLIATLDGKNIPLAVKSQEIKQSERCGRFSISFNPSDPIMNQPDEMVAICQVDEKTHEVEIYPLVKMDKILPHITDPKALSMKGKIRVAYARDIYQK